MEKTEEHITLLDIDWIDVLIPMISEQLSLSDLFNFRCCSRMAKCFVEAALERRKDINLEGNNSHKIELAFSVLEKCCHHVEILHLARCHWVTNELIIPFIAKNIKLREVDFSECERITPLALKAIGECKELRILKLSKCNWVTKGGIDALVSHLSYLVELDISGCRTRKESYLFLSHKLNMLKVLCMAKSPRVTSRVLIRIAMNCPNLEHIDLTGCEAISNYGINVLAHSCTQLKSLMVCFCPKVSERVLAPLRSHLHIDRPRMRW